ncbi:MAG: DUF1178 family protein [Burkholderiaceae bacterium]
MALKVFDLQCENSHVFEGWFASADAYEDQKARGLLGCPVCASTQVSRKVSAARLNVSHLRAQKAGTSSAQAVAAPTGEQLAQLQSQVLQQLRSMVRNTENVGDRFAQEARLMHGGEAPERPIRGTATVQEREALMDEGIDIMPIPAFLDDERLQ